MPNADLISGQVTNWTLSDRMRRIEIPVGVAYGTDPARVIELLQRTVTDHPEILGEPAPAVLFTRFGDSSLDFEVRAWTGRFENWVAVRSDLMTRICRALADAGIEIPFPQRDLHLRSVSAEAAAAAPSQAAQRPAAETGRSDPQGPGNPVAPGASGIRE